MRSRRITNATPRTANARTIRTMPRTVAASRARGMSPRTHSRAWARSQWLRGDGPPAGRDERVGGARGGFDDVPPTQARLQPPRRDVAVDADDVPAPVEPDQVEGAAHRHGVGLGA